MSQLKRQGLSVYNPGVLSPERERLRGSPDPQALSPEPDPNLLAVGKGLSPPQSQVGLLPLPVLAPGWQARVSFLSSSIATLPAPPPHHTPAWFHFILLGWEGSRASHRLTEGGGQDQGKLLDPAGEIGLLPKSSELTPVVQSESLCDPRLDGTGFSDKLHLSLCLFSLAPCPFPLSLSL